MCVRTHAHTHVWTRAHMDACKHKCTKTCTRTTWPVLVCTFSNLALFCFGIPVKFILVSYLELVWCTQPPSHPVQPSCSVLVSYLELVWCSLGAVFWSAILSQSGAVKFSKSFCHTFWILFGSLAMASQDNRMR